MMHCLCLYYSLTMQQLIVLLLIGLNWLCKVLLFNSICCVIGVCAILVCRRWKSPTTLILVVRWSSSPIEPPLCASCSVVIEHECHVMLCTVNFEPCVFFILGRGPFILLLSLWIRAWFQMYIGMKFVSSAQVMPVYQTL